MTGRRKASQHMIARARRLRRAATLPERLPWPALRGRSLRTFKFRRQEPIGPYVADFCCHAARLIIEIDGLSHEGCQQAGRAT